MSSAHLEPARQRVSQQDDITDLPYLGQGCSALVIEGKVPVTNEPASPRVTDKEWRHDEIELIR
jgi:hypothetical protein